MATDELETERQEIRGQHVKRRSEIPQLKAVVVGSRRESVRRRKVSKVAAGVRHSLGPEGPGQMIVAKPDAVCKGRSEHVLLASGKRVHAAPLVPEMGIETQRHLRDPRRLRAIEIADENTIVLVESLSML